MNPGQAEGFAFLLSQDSATAAPFAYLYALLMGGSEDAIRGVGVALHLAAVVVAFAAVRAGHSMRAAIVAALLIAVAPTLHAVVPGPGAEPALFFLTALWALAVARIAATAQGRATPWLVAGAIALSLAALTRPAIVGVAPVLALLFAWRGWRARGAGRGIEWRLAAMHAAAILAPALWILRNYLQFGLPSIATGAGVSLWLGLDPLVDGFDPGLYGMDSDVSTVVGDLAPLGVDGDRLLRDAASLQLHDIPLAVLAPMLAHKAAAFLFASASDLVGGLPWLRAWRVAMVVMAVAAFAFSRRSRFTLAVAGFAAVMLAMLLPTPYEHRSSVAVLDVPLALLAAIGLAECAASWRRAAVAGITLAAALAAGLVQIANPGPGAPHLERVRGEVIVTRDISWIEGIAAVAARRLRAGSYELAPGATLEIPLVGTPRFRPGDASALVLGMKLTPAAGGKGCDALRMGYRSLADRAFSPDRTTRVALDSDGKAHAVVAGTAVPMRLNHDGTLRLEFECTSPATLELGKITVVAPRRADMYRDRVMEMREALRDPYR